MCADTFPLSCSHSHSPSFSSRTSLSSCPQRPLSLPSLSLSFHPASLARSAPSLVTFHLFHRAANPYFCRPPPRPALSTLVQFTFLLPLRRLAFPLVSISAQQYCVFSCFFFFFKSSWSGLPGNVLPHCPLPLTTTPPLPPAINIAGQEIGRMFVLCYFSVRVFSLLRCYSCPHVCLRCATALLLQPDPIRLSRINTTERKK